MVDAPVWIDHLREFDLAVGPRIHGSVAAILAATPAVVLSYDSRTEEFAAHHEIPHFNPYETPAIVRLEQVLDRVDYTRFNQGQLERVRRVIDFLPTTAC